GPTGQRPLLPLRRVSGAVAGKVRLLASFRPPVVLAGAVLLLRGLSGLRHGSTRGPTGQAPRAAPVPAGGARRGVDVQRHARTTGGERISEVFYNGITLTRCAVKVQRRAVMAGPQRLYDLWTLRVRGYYSPGYIGYIANPPRPGLT